MKWLIFLFTIFLPLNAMADTYYVATDGSGDFTTIAQVNAATFSPGDEILFKRGDTWVEQLIIKSSGTVGNPIEYGSYGTGDKPIIDAGGTNQCIRSIGGKQYIDIVGLKLQNPNTSCVYMSDGSGGVGIRFIDCDFYGGTGSAGLRYVSSSGLIHGCYFVECGGGGIMTHESPNLIVEDCIVEDCGIAGTGNIDGIGINDGSSGTIVRNCIVRRQLGSGGSGIDMQDSTASTDMEYVFNCYVENGAGQGITLGGQVPVQAHNCIAAYNVAGNFASHSNIETYFYNCTGIGNSYGFKGGDTGDSGETNATLRNCIFYNVTTNIFLNKLTSVIDSDYNSLDPDANFQQYNGTATTSYNFTQWKSTFNQDAHSITGDPMLTDTYRLRKGSPAINAGTDVGVEEDYFGNKRVGTPDIGACEYVRRINNGNFNNGNSN